MVIKQLILAAMAAVLATGGVFAADDPYADKYAPRKKAYDEKRRVNLDKPFEVGKPGKTKYDPKQRTTTTSGVIVKDYGSDRTKYSSKYTKPTTGTKANYTATRRRGSKKEQEYAPIERTTVLKYNTMVVEANKRLKTEGKLYGKALKPIFFDEEADLDEVKAAQDNLTARVERIYKVMKAYNVPETKGSKELSGAHLAFLEYQKTIVEGPLNKVMELLEDPNIKPDVKREEIEKILKDVGKQESTFYLALKEAQDVYADAHNIEIVRETIVKPGEGQRIKVGDKTIELNGKQIKVNGRQVSGSGRPVREKTYYKKTETR